MLSCFVGCVGLCLCFWGEQAFNEHLTQNTGDLTFYKVLIRWGADVNAVNPSGERPLDYATKIKFVTTRPGYHVEETTIEFATMLIRAGADPALCKTNHEQDWHNNIKAAVASAKAAEDRARALSGSRAVKKKYTD
jgi:hypothetical protein